MIKIKNILMVVISSALMFSCSLEVGTKVTNSHFVYPNSNVTPLGQATAQRNKMMIIIPAQMKKKDYDAVFDEAISKYQDGDVLINYGIDTKYTQFLIFWFTRIKLKGTVAKMEVGKQDIGQ